MESASKAVLELKEDVTPEGYMPDKIDDSDNEGEINDHSQVDDDEDEPSVGPSRRSMEVEPSSPRNFENSNASQNFPNEEGQQESEGTEQKEYSKRPSLSAKSDNSSKNHKSLRENELQLSRKSSKKVAGSPVIELKTSPKINPTKNQEEIKTDVKLSEIAGLSSSFL